jgi:Uri superfamily endonuclease
VTGGTYTLVVAVPTRRTAAVGALGEVSFDPGWYAYPGSALGPGGFARVERHRAVAAGDREGGHWHVDALLAAAGTAVDAVVRSEAAVECAVARGIDQGTPVSGFGCTDCGCESHLQYAAARDPLVEAVERSHRAARA